MKLKNNSFTIKVCGVATILCLHNEPSYGITIAERLKLPKSLIQGRTIWDKARSGIKDFCNLTGINLRTLMGEDRETAQQLEAIIRLEESGVNKLHDIAQTACNSNQELEVLRKMAEASINYGKEFASELQKNKNISLQVNPAYYSNGEYQNAVRENLNADLEWGASKNKDYFLTGTRAEVIENDLWQKGSKNKELKHAAKYEDNVREALRAKKRVTIQFYREEIFRLEKDISLLEKKKQEKGLTVGDIMAIEQTIEIKRGVMRDLHEKITKGLEEGIKLTKKQKEKQTIYESKNKEYKLKKFLQEEKKRHREKYQHLW